jgi:hypothetical protein
MRRHHLAALAAGALALGFAAGPADAQSRRGSLTIDVTPRSWLSPPNVVAPGSEPGSMSRVAATATFVTRPSAYWTQRDRFGEDRLPDPISAGGGGFFPR